jgi:hypothetical protein
LLRVVRLESAFSYNAEYLASVSALTSDSSTAGWMLDQIDVHACANKGLIDARDDARLVLTLRRRAGEVGSNLDGVGVDVEPQPTSLPSSVVLPSASSSSQRYASESLRTLSAVVRLIPGVFHGAYRGLLYPAELGSQRQAGCGVV